MLILPVQNDKIKRSIESWSHLYFTFISLTILFQKQQEKK